MKRDMQGNPIMWCVSMWHQMRSNAHGEDACLYMKSNEAYIRIWNQMKRIYAYEKRMQGNPIMWCVSMWNDKPYEYEKVLARKCLLSVFFRVPCLFVFIRVIWTHETMRNVCCSVCRCAEQCVAVCCRVLQGVAVHTGRVFIRHDAKHVLQCVAVCVAVRCRVLQCVAGCCSAYRSCVHTTRCETWIRNEYEKTLTWKSYEHITRCETCRASTHDTMQNASGSYVWTQNTMRNVNTKWIRTDIYTDIVWTHDTMRNMITKCYPCRMNTRHDEKRVLQCM